MKNIKYHISGTIPQSNRKIGNIDTLANKYMTAQLAWYSHFNKTCVGEGCTICPIHPSTISLQ